jgi:hypothetical protein
MEWVRRENAEQRGQRSCRLSIGDGSWSVMACLRTPLQPASGWPSHCTIWAKHGGIASTLRTLLTSPLGLVRCPSPKMPRQRGCFFAAMQRRAAWDERPPRSGISRGRLRPAPSSGSGSAVDRGARSRWRCISEERLDRSGRGLGSKRLCGGAAAVGIHNSAAPTQGVWRLLARKRK